VEQAVEDRQQRGIQFQIILSMLLVAVRTAMLILAVVVEVGHMDILEVLIWAALEVQVVQVLLY
jgi:hypothetical protein